MPAGRRKGAPHARRGPRAALGRGARRIGSHLPRGRHRRPDDERSRRERRRDRRRSRRERKKAERKLRKRRWRRKERKARRKQAKRERKRRRRRRIRRLLLLPLLLLFLMMSCSTLTTMAVLSAVPEVPEIDLSAFGDAVLDFFGAGGSPTALGSTARYRESMITATTQRMLDTVIPLFGQGYGVGCYRSGEDGGEHPRGRACDFIMASPLNTMPTPEYLAHGWALCNFLIAHAGELHVRYIIWQKRIWFPASGWGPYTRYDGVTQGDLLRLNHYDHVHVSLNWVEGDRVI
jgi:hypothetical protein